MCGIAGFSGKKGLTKEQSRIATNKMKLLGMFNQSRGVHGCGLYINGKIYKGFDDLMSKKDTKLFDRFIADKDFVWPELDLTFGNLMFLHTRQATQGAQTEANTHPFLIKSADPKNNLVGVHNGTLDNIWDLCKKYDVNYVDMHIHVDSKALYTLIDKVGLDILKEYKGAAALLWTKPSEPHKMYVYHGATLKLRSDAKLQEERPMHFMQSAEGVYFSSMPESLLAIRESDKQTVEKLKHNTVFSFTDGKLDEVSVEVDREEANLTPEIVRNFSSYPSHQQGTRIAGLDANTRRQNFVNLRSLAEESERSAQLARIRKEGGSVANNNLKTPSSSLIWAESKPSRALNTRDVEVIYFQKGRYFRSAGDALCNGLVWIKGRGVISSEDETEQGAEPYWFYHGVMMKNVTAWEALVEEANQEDSWVSSMTSNYAYDISRYSKYPVTHLEGEALDADPYFRYSWYADERRVTAKIRPMFSGRCYDIEDGFLVEIIPSNGDDKKTLDIVDRGTGVEDDVLPGECCSVPFDVNPKHANTSVYDIVFDKMKTVMETLTFEEIQAMALFVEDALKAEGFMHGRQEVEAEMWCSVRTGIAAHKTIRESLNDQLSNLDNYLKIVTELKVGDRDIITVNSIEEMIEVGDDIVQQQINFYSRFGKGDDEAFVDAESPFPASLDSIGVVVSEEAKDRYVEDLEEAFANHDAILKEKESTEQAAKHIDKAIDLLSEVTTIADELQANTGDFAQDAAKEMYLGLGSIKKNLSEICSNHFQDELIIKLNQSIHV